MPRPVKYVDTTDVKILSARKRAKESYKRRKVKDLSDVAKAIISKNKELGIKSIERKLRSSDVSYTRKNIREFLKNEHNIIKQTSGMVNRHIVANFLGDWCFDIIVNRGIRNKDGERYKEFEDEKIYPEYFPIFMHTNSGYVFIYGANKKDEPSQYTWQKQFMHDLKLKFHGYPVVNVRSDEESAWNNKRGYLGKHTTLQKRKDDKHILMARINNFASGLRAAVYKLNDHYSKYNPPLTTNNVYEFTSKWNQAKVRGMDCTREQMMKDKKLELAYICGNLYGNLKKREEEQPIELHDVVQFKAPDNYELKRNRQQKPGQLAPGHYEIVSVNGDDIEVRHLDGTGEREHVPKDKITNIQKQAANKPKAVFVKPNAEQNHIDVIPAPPVKDMEKEVRIIYNANQKNWENISFPSEWRPEKMYEAFKKIYDQLTQEQQNKLMGEHTLDDLKYKLRRGNFRQLLQEKLWNVADTLDISKTDGDERFERIRTILGRPQKEEFMKTIEDNNPVEEFMKSKPRSRKNQKRGRSEKF